MAADVKSSYDWLAHPDYSHIMVMDPDGWDRSNYEASMEELITESEFQSRLMQSTIVSPRKPSYEQ